MKAVIWVAVAAVFATACGKGGDKNDDEVASEPVDEEPSAGVGDEQPSGTARDPKEVARAFVEAMIARDDARAAALLLPVDTCAGAPADQRAGCEQSAVAMRDQLHSLRDDYPATMVIDRIEQSAEEMRADHVTTWDIYARGDTAPSAVIFIVTMNGKSYASYPVKPPGDPDAPEVPEIVEQ